MPRPGHEKRLYRYRGDWIHAGIDARHVVAALGPGDEAVAAIATAQHGAISVEQLRICGITASQVRARVRSGRLHPRHRGVYLVGHEATTGWTEVIAATLAGGPGQVAWAQTACWLHGFMPALGTPLHLAGLRHRRNREGIDVHRDVGLLPTDITVIERIPVVKPAPALRSLAALTDVETTRRALNEARTKGLAIDRRLVEHSARLPRASGWGKLSVLLADDAGPDFTRQEAEAKLWRLILASGLPRPLRNQRIHGYEVDLLWPRHGVVVELDGYAFHSSPNAFERDRAKWADLEARGLSVTPFTWKQIVHRRVWLIAHVASRLAQVSAANSCADRTA